MRRTVSTLLATGLMMTALLAAGCSASSAGGSAADPVGLVAARCTRCHNASRIKAARHDAAGWTSTITRMRGKGAKLDDTEEKAVVEFLAGGGASKL